MPSQGASPNRRPSVCWLPLVGAAAVPVPTGKANGLCGGATRRKEPGPAALATTGRRVSLSSFCGGRACCSPPLPVALSVCCCLGALAAAAASPPAKPPAGVVAAPGCPSTSARDRRPSGGLGGRPWLLSVCWRGAASAGSRRAFPRPKWAGNGTQITYVAYISCAGMVFGYENKRDRVCAGFDRQAG